MKKVLLLICCIALGATSFAQTQRNCSVNEHMDYLIQQDPSIVERMQAIEAQTQEILSNQNAQRAVDGVITIPTVVHVIWNQSKPQENISVEQIQSQIDVLNADFRRLNADASNTLDEFLSVATDMEIEFCLATVDPDGNPTTGIQRKSSTRGSWGTGNAMKRSGNGGFDAWPRDSYINMWVCNIGSSILGFATFPGGNAADDGVVMSPQYFGTNDADVNNNFYLSAPFDLGRTTTHEVGHWLNLRHIWGDGPCASDDGVGDTPRSDNPNYSCPLTHVSCQTKDMVQNYMDYTHDACMNIYTAGQKARARALFEPNGARAALLNTEGCGTPEPTCLPPTGIAATSITNTGALINFNGAFFADWYVIELSENDGPFNFVEQIPDPEFGVVSNITFDIGSLSTCTEYTVQITAHCDNLNGDEAAQFTFITTGPECEPLVCEIPENLTASNITFTQATLSWDAIEGAESYTANGRLKGGLGLITRNKTVTENSFRTAGLFPFLTYEWRVKANCGDIGNSVFSPYSEFTLNPFARNSGAVTNDPADIEVVKLFDTDQLIQAYPNPSNGVVALNYYGQDLDDVQLVISDVTGKDIRSFSYKLVVNQPGIVDMSDLERGLYMLTFKKDGVNLHTEKVMIVR